MNPDKALWEKGDFTRIGETMRESGTALVAKLGITKGLNVLHPDDPSLNAYKYRTPCFQQCFCLLSTCILFYSARTFVVFANVFD